MRIRKYICESRDIYLRITKYIYYSHDIYLWILKLFQLHIVQHQKIQHGRPIYNKDSVEFVQKQYLTIRQGSQILYKAYG